MLLGQFVWGLLFDICGAGGGGGGIAHRTSVNWPFLFGPNVLLSKLAFGPKKNCIVLLD